MPGDAIETFVWDVQDGIAYDVRVRSVNQLGVRSDITDPWSATVTGHVVLGKSERPGDVQNFTAQQNANLVVLKWDQVTDLDLAGYEIRYDKQA